MPNITRFDPNKPSPRGATLPFLIIAGLTVFLVVKGVAVSLIILLYVVMLLTLIFLAGYDVQSMLRLFADKERTWHFKVKFGEIEAEARSDTKPKGGSDE